MAETEASALLRAGAIYPRRIGLRDPGGRLIFAGVKRGAFSLYFDDEPIHHFDLDGRWQRAYVDGTHVRKALNQSVDLIGRSRVPEGIMLHRRAASRAEIDSFDDSIRAQAIDVCVGLSEGRYTVVPPPDPASALDLDDLRDLLDQVAGWDAAAWFARREAYVRVYGLGQDVIPPDAQNAIVLHTSNGEGWPRDAVAFGEHCRDVSQFLGRRAIQASTAFLDGASFLRRPLGDVLAILDEVQRVFTIREDSRPVMPRDLPPDLPSLSGIELALAPGPHPGPLPDLEGWRSIAGRRVRRVTYSLGETGVGEDASSSITDAKRAGLAVSMTLTFGEEDVSRLASLADAINALPLGRGDCVYLMGSQREERQAERDGECQRGALKMKLAPTRLRGARLVDYNQAKQWT